MTTPNSLPSPVESSTPAWHAQLPPPVRTMWEEVCRALESHSFTLVAQGARTLIERVSTDRTGSADGTFAASLKALENEGYIGRRQKHQLQLVVEAGNAAAHRSFDLNQKEARLVHHLTENLLRSAYMPEEQVDALRTQIPPRRPGGRR
ncbi:DUF4145 domain-containing protein [Archangium violaceum]|uniref:DUF4145 domain-containing protein n=1 Tax=Archangium violaceum TaxID=83451 RepID=UPI001950A6E0|nr:DUF4145 domain-containing protein [Archangium violaceum]QRN99357.1 DUF4145 domain-containing protein [Archangium violaceum]